MSKLSRRKFVTKSGLVAAATLAAPAFTFAAEDNKDIFIHHVYFWLKNADSAEDKAKLIEGLKKLSVVKTIQKFYIGKPADTNRDVIDHSYSISWMLMFKNKADQDSYQVDPIHLNFVKECSALWTKVIVYDSVSAV
jgi:hypothetical protein